ncbi:MAG: hypothetical protein HC809_11015 [Gammaproteobacteria bacterium]|nr:hypothetical protein [Gammaproteobacteria bacterium]
MTAAVRLPDIERRLALFANGITGRHHEIRSYDDEGVAADAVSLPATFDAFIEVAHNLGAYRCMTLHQIAYQEFGTYTFRMTTARQRCAALAARDAVAGSARQSDYDQFYAHFGHPGVAQRIFEVLEGHRIDMAMTRRYPGIERHYRRLCAWELERRGHPAELLDQVLDDLVRWTLGDDPSGSMAGFLITIAHAVRAVAADVYTTAATTTAIYDELERAGLVPAALATFEVLDAPATERPTFQGPPPNEWLQREDRLSDWYDLIADLDEAMESETDDPQDGQSVVGRRLLDERDTLARRADMERSALASALDPEDARGRRSTWYPEWDHLLDHYRPRWCRVYEESLDADPDSDPAAALRRMASHRAKVRDCFAHLPRQALQRVRHVIDGEELNWDDVVRYAVDRHRGEVPDERVYQRRERAARDVATAFLVDLSASTDDPVVKPTPPSLPSSDAPYPNLRDPFDDDGYLWSAAPAAPEETPRRIIDVLRESLWLMAAGLNDWGDAFAIYGFSGYGRLCVEFATVKDFRDHWDARAARALVAMKPRRSTRMGPAIRHTQRKLAATGAAVQIMVLLSDGFPQDCDYGPDRGNHDYGVADTGKALREAEAAGIRTFCVTVDRSGHDYLSAMCPHDRYLVIEDIDELPSALAQVYRRLTA